MCDSNGKAFYPTPYNKDTCEEGMRFTEAIRTAATPTNPTGAPPANLLRAGSSSHGTAASFGMLD